jgi:hypothetical protein
LSRKPVLSKDFYTAGFDALLSNGTCVSKFVEVMSRNKCFSQVKTLHILRFYPFVTYILTPLVYRYYNEFNLLNILTVSHNTITSI